jgi:putative hydrolase of HD superfamily
MVRVMEEQRLEQQMKFVLELDKIKSIVRQTYLANGERKEDDAEHSWHLALMCFTLAEYANEPIDVFRTMKMVLLHDVIEIDAGDTYAYDQAGNDTKRERELAAAERIFPLLPKDQAIEYRNLWDEFEDRKTPEAKFARVLDNAQPILLNDASGGKSWREHSVKKSQIMKRNEKTSEGSKKIWDYLERVIEENIKKGNIIDDM